VAEGAAAAAARGIATMVRVNKVLHPFLTAGSMWPLCGVGDWSARCLLLHSLMVKNVLIATQLDHQPSLMTLIAAWSLLTAHIVTHSHQIGHTTSRPQMIPHSA
jgi:hypothetical protein